MATALTAATTMRSRNMQKISPPSPWVTRFLNAMGPVESDDGRPGGEALDVACGAGRHIAPCRALGLHVLAIDKDISRAARFADDPWVTLCAEDLESENAVFAPPATYNIVIVTNYLWRPILADIVSAVGSRGMLIYETFAVGNELFGKPSNPDFLLRPGELLEAVSGRLVPIAYEHRCLENPERAVQRICAVHPDHEWLSAPPKV